MRITANAPANSVVRAVPINGQWGLITYADGHIFSALTFDIIDGKIHRIFQVMNPDKLKHLPATPPDL